MQWQHVLSLSLKLPKRRLPVPVESTDHFPYFDVHGPLVPTAMGAKHQG